MKSMLLTLPVLFLFGATSCTSSSDDLADNADTEHMMSFFLTSVGSGNGGDLGGLEGADQHCQALATAAGFGDQMWNAYLSSTGSDGSSGINARDRIGSGPWYNFAGDQVATDVDNLHGENNLTKETVLNELGAMTNGRGDDPNRMIF